MTRAPISRGCACLAVILGAVFMAVVPGHARAHHGSATARAGGGSIWWDGYALDGAVPAPRLTTGLVYAGRYFGRVLNGSDDYGDSELGRVTLHALNLQVALDLPTGTVVGLQFAAGVVALDGAAGPQTGGGVGDLELFVAQRLVAATGREAGAFTLTARAGLTLPTGHYVPGPRLSVTDIVGQPGGQLGLITYNTQTSLGAGVWAPFAGLASRIALGRSSALLVDGALAVPASTTSDGMRWGADLNARIGLVGAFGAGRFTVTGALAYRHHFRDQVKVVDDTTGEVHHDLVGGRDEVALTVDLGLAVSKIVTCTAGVHVPIYQYVRGIQLVESVSGTAGCAVAWGL